MFATNAYKSFAKDTKVKAVSPIGLVVTLYDGCIGEMKRSIIHMNMGQISEKFVAMQHAVRIIQEGLIAGLDPKYNRELCELLRDNYQFVVSHLIVGVSQNDQKKINDCIEIMEQLKSSWVELEKGLKV